MSICRWLLAALRGARGPSAAKKGWAMVAGVAAFLALVVGVFGWRVGAYYAAVLVGVGLSVLRVRRLSKTAQDEGDGLVTIPPWITKVVGLLPAATVMAASAYTWSGTAYEMMKFAGGRRFLANGLFATAQAGVGLGAVVYLVRPVRRDPRAVSVSMQLVTAGVIFALAALSHYVQPGAGRVRLLFICVGLAGACGGFIVQALTRTVSLERGGGDRASSYFLLCWGGSMFLQAFTFGQPLASKLHGHDYLVLWLFPALLLTAPWVYLLPRHPEATPPLPRGEWRRQALARAKAVGRAPQALRAGLASGRRRAEAVGRAVTRPKELGAGLAAGWRRAEAVGPVFARAARMVLCASLAALGSGVTLVACYSPMAANAKEWQQRGAPLAEYAVLLAGAAAGIALSLMIPVGRYAEKNLRWTLAAAAVAIISAGGIGFVPIRDAWWGGCVPLIQIVLAEAGTSVLLLLYPARLNRLGQVGRAALAAFVFIKFEASALFVYLLKVVEQEIPDFLGRYGAYQWAIVGAGLLTLLLVPWLARDLSLVSPSESTARHQPVAGTPPQAGGRTPRWRLVARGSWKEPRTMSINWKTTLPVGLALLGVVTWIAVAFPSLMLIGTGVLVAALVGAMIALPRVAGRGSAGGAGVAVPVGVVPDAVGESVADSGVGSSSFRERELAGVRAIQIDGDRSHPTIVAFNGWTRDKRYWEWLSPLADWGFGVVALDLPGLGAPAGPMSLFSQGGKALQKALNVLESEGHREFVLLGHSTGCAVIDAYHTGGVDPRVVGNFLVAPFGVTLSREARKELWQARWLLRLPRSWADPKLARMAAEWSAAPYAPTVDSDGVREQLRLILRYVKEMKLRCDWGVLGDDTAVLLCSRDRKVPLETAESLPLEHLAWCDTIKSHHTPTTKKERHQVSTQLIRFLNHLQANRAPDAIEM